MLFMLVIRRKHNERALRWYFDSEIERDRAYRAAVELGAASVVRARDHDYVSDADEVRAWLGGDV